MSQYSLLIEKCSHYDKDERYMATNDLCNLLQREAELEQNLESRICQAVLKQLDDDSNDVQSIAVKCLGILLGKVHHNSVMDISDRLCTLILTGRPELRDIYSIGLKTLISDVPEETGVYVAQQITQRLISGVEMSGSSNGDVAVECLDNLTDLLQRFGRVAEVVEVHADLLGIVLDQLANPRPVIRKRAVSCLGALSAVVDDALLERLITTLLSRIDAAGGDAFTLLQTVGTVSRSVGHRMGPHLHAMVPLFLRTCGSPEDEALQTERGDDLRESSFQAFAALAARCRPQVDAFLEEMVACALRFMDYDPNYTYDEGGDMRLEEEEEEEDYDEDYADEEDDDDTSWKVRRAALKVLSTAVSGRPERLEAMYASCGLPLLLRLKEREEMVRLEVLKCFASLVDATIAHPSPASHAALSALVPPLLLGVEAQLRGTSAKAKSAAVDALKTVCNALPDAFEEHLPRLVAAAAAVLRDPRSAQALRLDALGMLRTALGSHSAAAWAPSLPLVLPLAASCAADEWYKISAEALRLVAALVAVLRPLSPLAAPPPAAQVADCLSAALPALRTHDIDQEVKEAAILAAGALARHCCDALPADGLSELLGLVMQRLRGEATRVAALRALAGAAESPLRPSLGPVRLEAMAELSSLLRQSNRPLLQGSLEALAALAALEPPPADKPGDGALYERLLREAAPLFADSDLRTAHLAIRLSVAALGAAPGAASAVREDVLPKALELCASPVLQGAALESLLAFFEALVALDAPGATFADLLSALRNVVEGASKLELPRQSIANVAAATAAICAAAPPAQRGAALADFAACAASAGATGRERQLALLCIGEVGRRTDLSTEGTVRESVMACLSAPADETRTAAAVALGAVASGNPAALLPELLGLAGGAPGAAAQEAGAQGGRYLMLTALREALLAHLRGGCDVRPHAGAALGVLLGLCGLEDEAVRNVVAECLGALVVVAPQDAVGGLLGALGGAGGAAEGARVRWTLATGLRCAMGGAAPSDALAAAVGPFLELLGGEDLEVRRAALLLLNSALHHRSGIVAPLLAGLVPVLGEVLGVYLERVVDLGPFKHKVDDGLPLRKAAMGCVYTALGSCPEALGAVEALMPRVAAALADKNEDMMLLAHQVLQRACAAKPGAVLAAADALVEPLDKALHKKEKSNSVGHEVERANELLRSAMRTVIAVSRIDGADGLRAVAAIMDKIRKKERLRALYAAETADA